MLPRRRFLALLGLAPVAVPAALAAAVRPVEPFLVAGADIGGDPIELTVVVRDFASAGLRVRAKDLADLSAALQVTVADEIDPYPLPIRPETAPRGSAGAVAGAVRTSPLGRFLPTTGRGLRAPASFGRA